jgi:tRNA threonylcarbamoyl adenosine modification protein YeaZ
MTTLAIETAIRGGSLSLIKDEQEIDFWIGNKNVSKAEDVLEQISNLLKINQINNIDLIAVSKGPGSSTGIRIGLATALGLSKPFSCKVTEVSVFEALTYNRTINKPTIMAISVGSRQIAWQVFEKDISCQKHRTTEIEIGNKPVFLNLLNKRNFTHIILHSELTEIVLKNNKKSKTGRVEVMDDKFATLIGLKGKQILAEKQVLSKK